jgi:WD40 repeat protein
MSYLLNLPHEIQFFIFAYLDPQSLFECFLLNQEVNHYLCSCSSTLWKLRSRYDYQLKELPRNIKSYKDLYELHWRIEHKQYNYSKTKESPDVLTSLPNTPHRQGLLTRQKSNIPLCIWPSDSDQAYNVALCQDYVCWVNMLDTTVISVCHFSDLSCSLPQQSQSLLGHTAPVGLLLSNHSNTLVSFDETSFIFVWNVRNNTLERKVNCQPILEVIVSMNVHKNQVVAGGKNGVISVWNLQNGQLLHSFSLQEEYIEFLSVFHLLNVSLYENKVAYGLGNGQINLYCLSEKRIIKEFDLRKVRRTHNGQFVYDGNNSISSDPDQEETEIALDRYLDRITHEQEEEDADEILDPHEHEEILYGPEWNEEMRVEAFLDRQGPADFFLPLPFLFNFSPLTLVLSSHMLLTNGIDKKSLFFWNLKTNQPFALSIPDKFTGETIRYAELSNDGSLIFGDSDSGSSPQFVTWDFMKQSNKRKIEKRPLDLGLDIWIVFEES